MKNVMKKSMAMVLLSISIAASGLYPVRAESTVSGNNLGMGTFMDNSDGSEGDAADSGSDAAGTESKEAGFCNGETCTEDTVSEDANADGGRKDGESVSEGDAAADAEDSGGTDASGGGQEGGNRKDGESVSEGVNAADTDNLDGTDASGGGQEGGNRKDGESVSGGDVAADAENSSETEASEDGQEEGNKGVAVDAEAGADMAGTGDAAGESAAGGISTYDLTVYPDDRLMQWNMGNSSGKYGKSIDSYAVFDDNVIAALYGLGNDTYRLELTGTGEMAGLGYYDYQPYKAYRNKIVSLTVGEGITNVGSEVFARFSKLQEYTLSASVKTIGENAFEYCTSLRAVVIPDTVESLSHYCFQHCEGATSLTITGDLDYNGLNIPFFDMKNLKDIYITPGRTGAANVSQVKNPTSSPANISDGYTIHFMEGVTEIHDNIFANTKASRIVIADSVTVIGTDAFAKKAFDTSTIPDYIVLGDNTRTIAAKAFMASVQTLTPTTVEIGNVYQYEYDWAAVRREVTFVARLNALRELAAMVEGDRADGTLTQERYPAAKWRELQDELAAANELVEGESSDRELITDSFIRLYDLYHYEATADFILTMPAEMTLTEDVENNQITGVIPITIEFLHRPDSYSIYIDNHFVMQDKQSGRTLKIEYQLEDVSENGSIDSGFEYNLWLTGERFAGDWEGTVSVTFSCVD